MPRKGHVSKREVLPDPVTRAKLVTKLINSVMLDGKKGVATENRLQCIRHSRRKNR